MSHDTVSQAARRLRRCRLVCAPAGREDMTDETQALPEPLAQPFGKDLYALAVRIRDAWFALDPSPQFGRQSAGNGDAADSDEVTFR